MGSGKSTLGKRLARKISFEFMDMDHFLEQQEGLSIEELFSQRGEAYFRQQEAGLLQSLDPARDMVVATGGGAPCHGNNMELMNQKGVTVYLKMSAASLVSRLQNARAVRPLIKELSGEQLREYVQQKLQEREPVYGKAKCIVKGENVKPAHVSALVFGYS